MMINEPYITFQTSIAYVFPFIAFYLGIYMRHALRDTVFRDDVLGLRQLCIIGMLFAILAVAPLLRSFALAADDADVAAYLMTLAVVIQAGLFMPESFARIIRTRSSASTASATGIDVVGKPENGDDADSQRQI